MKGPKAKPKLESSAPFLLLCTVEQSHPTFNLDVNGDRHLGSAPHSQVREYSVAGLAVKFVLIPSRPNIPSTVIWNDTGFVQDPVTSASENGSAWQFSFRSHSVRVYRSPPRTLGCRGCPMYMGSCCCLHVASPAFKHSCHLQSFPKNECPYGTE